MSESIPQNAVMRACKNPVCPNKLLLVETVETAYCSRACREQAEKAESELPFAEEIPEDT
jgi:hypothetical protein